MAGNAYAHSFRDLIVYQKSLALSDRIFVESKAFPMDERFSLTDQIRRSVRSIGAQIAEAWAKRRYEKHFVSKLSDADGEQMETQHWVIIAGSCKYVATTQVSELISSLEEIGKMLNSMMANASRFCETPGGQVRESNSEYFTGPIFTPIPDPTDH